MGKSDFKELMSSKLISYRIGMTGPKCQINKLIVHWLRSFLRVNGSQRICYFKELNDVV